MPRLSPVSYKQLAKVFEADGFRCVRIEGDHMVAVFIIKNNLRTAGMTRDRYFELLTR